MTTLVQLRRTALSLPGTAEPGSGSFTVDETPFAAVEDGEVRLHLAAAEVARCLADCPAARRVPAGVAIRLADIDGQRLNHYVRRAWLHRAPAELAAKAAAAASAVPGAVGDLPRSIGRPATQALACAAS